MNAKLLPMLYRWYADTLSAIQARAPAPNAHAYLPTGLRANDIAPTRAHFANIHTHMPKRTRHTQKKRNTPPRHPYGNVEEPRRNCRSISCYRQSGCESLCVCLGAFLCQNRTNLCARHAHAGSAITLLTPVAAAATCTAQLEHLFQTRLDTSAYCKADENRHTHTHTKNPSNSCKTRNFNVARLRFNDTHENVLRISVFVPLHERNIFRTENFAALRTVKVSVRLYEANYFGGA